MKTLRAICEIPAAVAVAMMALVFTLSGCAGIPQRGIISPEFQLPVTKNIQVTECYYQTKGTAFTEGKGTTFKEGRVPEASLPRAEVAKAKEKIMELFLLLGNEGYNVELTTPPPHEICKRVGGEDVEGAVTMSVSLLFAPKNDDRTRNTITMLVGLKPPQSGILIASLLVKRLDEKSMGVVVAYFKNQLELRAAAVTAGTKATAD